MKLKKIKQTLLRFIGHFVLSSFVNVLCKTLRITLINENAVSVLKKKRIPFVLAFWHSTMFLPWYLHRNEKFTALTSKSKDGDLLARLLTKWKYNVIRGSSSSGGDDALNLLIENAKSGSAVSITPDGPRGPVFQMKAGAVITAKKSGVPLVLLGIGYQKKKILNSWDKFEIPKPFSNVKAVYSDPIYVSQDLSYEQTFEVIKNCELKLNELQHEAQIF